MRKSLQLVTWITLTAIAPCLAADSAVLRNGYAIRHEHRQVIGTITRLYLGGDQSSFVDIPTEEIDHIDALPEETTPPVPTEAAKATLAPAIPAPSTPGPPDLDRLVKTASGTYRLDPDLVNSVIRAESGFNVRAVSPKGAQGLMQLMPQTAAQLGVQNPFDPEANVEGGTRYLRELLERYDFDLIKALAAYNAGPQRVEQYGGVPPYYETRAYVARIVRDFNQKKLAAKAEAKAAATKARSSKQPAPTKSKSSPDFQIAEVTKQ
jgi:soluble lytic murein transglycosylase-like protein